MPEPKISFCLHNKAASNGHQPLYLRVGVGETRPVHPATGCTRPRHPAHFSPTPPHALKGADGYRTLNE